MIGAFRKLFPRHSLDKVLRRAIEEAVPLGILCDVLTDAMSLEPEDSQKVLAELDIGRRCGLGPAADPSTSCGPRKSRNGGTWPPEFSLN